MGMESLDMVKRYPKQVKLNATVSKPGSNWTYGFRTLVGKTPVNLVWYAKGIIKNKWFHVLPKRI